MAEVVVNDDRATEYRSERYSSHHTVALEMLAEASVEVRFVSPKASLREFEGHAPEPKEPKGRA
jgi:hypothetical protein